MADFTFSFIVPTRGRPASLLRLCGSIRACTSHLDRLQVVLVVDDDDAGSMGFDDPALCIRKVVVTPGLTMGSLNMAGYRASSGRYLMLMNDDVVIRTPNWDERVLPALGAIPDGIALVHVNDLLFGEKLCTFPLVSRAFCEMAGGICPEGYRRYCIDNHIQNVFDLLSLSGYRRRIFLPDVVFAHSNVTETADGTHYVPDSAVHAADTLLFEKLLPERRRLAAEAAGVISRVTPDPPARSQHTTIAVISSDPDSGRTRACVERIRANTRDYTLEVVQPGEINRWLESCGSGYLAVVDDRVSVESGWLDGMLRAMEPGVGIVTPVYQDRTGAISCAGLMLEPDDSGRYAPVLAIAGRPQHTEALDGAVMLVDTDRCGRIRIDEAYAGPYAAIDYGLRVWEQSSRVVCSPWSRVTVDGSRPEELEQQRLRFVRLWMESGRLAQLRMRFWGAIDEFARFAALRDRMDALFADAASCTRDEFFLRARPVIEDLTHLPALRNYLVSRARAELGPRTARADDPERGNWAVLLGLSGQPALYQRGVYGFVLVLRGSRFYAIPGSEEIFDSGKLCLGGYARSFESGDPGGIRKLIARHWVRPPGGHISEGPSRNGNPSKLNVHTEAVPLQFDERSIGVVVQRLIRAIPYLRLLRSSPGLFDPEYYRRMYPEIAAAGADPLLHFVIAGAFEGCQPHPLFDPAFYFWKYPDVRRSNVNPLGHYLRCGTAEKRQPHPLFDTAYYLEQYPDVRQSGENPLVHYVRCGAAEGRRPHRLFDPKYYLDACPSARRASNPLVHFLEAPPREFCSPHPDFDCERYLSRMPAGSPVYINPLIHFVLFR